jgi:hypothetical protein
MAGTEIWAALLAAAVGALITGTLAWIRGRSEARLGYQLGHFKDLWNARRVEFTRLWTLTEIMPRYRPQGNPQRGQMSETVEALHGWYFAGGGLLLTNAGRDRFFAVQNELYACCHGRPPEEVGETSTFRDSSRSPSACGYSSATTSAPPTSGGCRGTACSPPRRPRVPDPAEAAAASPTPPPHQPTPDLAGLHRAVFRPVSGAGVSRDQHRPATPAAARSGSHTSDGDELGRLAGAAPQRSTLPRPSSRRRAPERAARGRW